MSKHVWVTRVQRRAALLRIRSDKSRGITPDPRMVKIAEASGGPENPTVTEAWERAKRETKAGEATLWYAVQAYGRIDPARRAQIDEEIQSIIAGHNCDVMKESQCNVEFVASTSHNEESKVRTWLGLDDRRIDGYASHEDAAAGYMTRVGMLRYAMQQAIDAIDDGDPASAIAKLKAAEMAWLRDYAERHAEGPRSD